MVRLKKPLDIHNLKLLQPTRFELMASAFGVFLGAHPKNTTGYAVIRKHNEIYGQFGFFAETRIRTFARISVLLLPQRFRGRSLSVRGVAA